MQLYGALVLFGTLYTACGLSCYTCGQDDPSCLTPLVCPLGQDRCVSSNLLGVVTKGCMLKDVCITPLICCEGDFCNSDKPTGSGVKPTGSTCSLVFLLVYTAIITLFL